MYNFEPPAEQAVQAPRLMCVVYVALLKIAFSINALSLVVGMTLLVVVLVLTMSLATASNDSEIFGYILSLGPLLIVNSLCGIVASQKLLKSSLAIYWLTNTVTLCFSVWTFHADGHLHPMNGSLTGLIGKLVISICGLQLIAVVLATLCTMHHYKLSSKNADNPRARYDEGESSAAAGMRLVSLSPTSATS